MSKPISPSEVVKVKQESLPDGVFDAFNQLIAENWKGTPGSAVVMQQEAAKRVAKLTGTTEKQVYERGWLDIEEVYRKAGWRVVYDKPAYNEDYEASFTFTSGLRGKN